MFTQRHDFNDVDQHACAINGWNQVYDQLGAGVAHTSLEQLVGQRFQLFCESLDKRVVQQGEAPNGRLCIALPLPSASAALFQGKNLGMHGIAILRGSQEFVVQAAEGMGLMAVSVEEEHFEALIERELPLSFSKRLDRLCRLEINDAALADVRGRLQCLLGSASHFGEESAERIVLDAVAELLSNGIDRDDTRSGNHAVSAYLVQKSQEIMLANTDESFTMLDLCERLNVSRRTLQRSFQCVTDMRPVEYLRSIRLNAVRRKLKASEAGSHTVARIASDYGFVHLGHFSSYYRTLFGECPSATPRACH